MAIVKSIARALLGRGNANTAVQRIGVATNVGDTTITLPSAGSLAPTMSIGKVRVKTNTIGVNSTSLVKKITGTDGVTTVDLYGGGETASAAGNGIDHEYNINTDLNLTTISVVVTVATANCTHDVEVAGNS